MRWFHSKFIPELNTEHSLTILFPRITRHIVRFFFVRKHYQQRATAPTTVLLTLRRCDLERALGGDICCAKKKKKEAILSDGMQYSHFHCFVPHEPCVPVVQHPTIL